VGLFLQFPISPPRSPMPVCVCDGEREERGGRADCLSKYVIDGCVLYKTRKKEKVFFSLPSFPQDFIPLAWRRIMERNV